MDAHARAAQPSRSRVFARLVHAYTALGAVLAFVGVRAVLRSDERLAFLTMFAATIVDATDGVLARRARVKDVLPELDGARLDDIVDYLTFVFLPMLLIERAGGLPPSIALPVVGVVLIASAFGFSASDAKTDDHFFTGFPSYWNIVVFYLYVFQTSPAVNAAVLLVLSATIFVPIGFIYPSRTPMLRPLTLLLGSAWAVSMAVLIWRLPDPPRWLAIASLAFPVYYLVASLILNARRQRVTAT